jgi:DNA replication protein DnaC
MRPHELSKDLAATLKALKLGKLLPLLPERLRQIRERNLAFEDGLLIVLADEVQRRDRNRLVAKARRAKLAPSLVFDAWNPNADVTYNRQLLDDLRLLRFIEDHHHVLIMGPVGVGKTMLAHALGHLAIQRDYSVHCESADKLFQRLRGSRLDDTHATELHKLRTVDLLIIDDFALRMLSEDETADLFEIVTARHQTASIVLTSNRDPSEWLPLLSDPLLAQALVDRFTNNAYDLVIEGESYRKRQKPTLRSTTEPEPTASR